MNEGGRPRLGRTYGCVNAGHSMSSHPKNPTRSTTGTVECAWMANYTMLPPCARVGFASKPRRAAKIPSSYCRVRFLTSARNLS
jgi:hypothetical protein